MPPLHSLQALTLKLPLLKDKEDRMDRVDKRHRVYRVAKAIQVQVQARDLLKLESLSQIQAQLTKEVKEARMAHQAMVPVAKVVNKRKLLSLEILALQMLQKLRIQLVPKRDAV